MTIATLDSIIRAVPLANTDHLGQCRHSIVGLYQFFYANLSRRSLTARTRHSTGHCPRLRPHIWTHLNPHVPKPFPLNRKQPNSHLVNMCPARPLPCHHPSHPQLKVEPKSPTHPLSHARAWTQISDYSQRSKGSSLTRLCNAKTHKLRPRFSIPFITNQSLNAAVWI